MGMMDRMMKFMMGRMSTGETDEMMSSMMDNFFADMTDEEKQKMMAEMMPKMMEGMNMMEIMPQMMMGMMGGDESSSAMMSKMMGGAEDMSGVGGMMSMMMGDGEEMEMPMNAQMMLTMIPQCAAMVLPETPKDQRTDYVVTMVAALIEHGSAGMSDEEKVEFTNQVMQEVKDRS